MSKLNNNFFTVGKKDTSADFNTANYPTDWDAIVEAVKAAAIATTKRKVIVKYTDDGIYEVKKGTTVGARIDMVSNVTLEFEPKVKVLGTRSFDWLILNPSINGSAPVENFRVKGGTFDLAGVINGSGFAFRDTIKSGVQNCTFLNSSPSLLQSENICWFTYFGSENSDSSTFRGKNNFAKNCFYQNHTGPKEMCLVFNQDNFIEENCIYKNKIEGPMFGLWQNVSNSRIKSPTYLDSSGYNYYSTSIDNTVFENIYANNVQDVLKGANLPDNVIFNTITKNLVVNGLTAIGGLNSVNATALQIGGVTDGKFKVDLIQGYGIGIVFNGGNTPVNALSTNNYLKLGTIKNGNPLALNKDLNAAILFNKGGSYNLIIEGGEIYDDQATKTQLVPVFFENDGVDSNYSNIRFNNTRLNSYSSNDSVRKNATVTLDPATVQFNLIRGKTNVGLTSFYNDFGAVANPTANATTAGIVSTTTQQFAGRKEFIANEFFVGEGITDFTRGYADIGNLGTNNTYIRAKHNTNADADVIIDAKGTGKTQVTKNAIFDKKVYFGSDKSTAGLELKQFSTTDRDAIVAPAEGSLIYNATTDKVQTYTNGSWVDIAATTTPTISDLSIGTITATDVPINISNGTDITTLPAASKTLAGVVTATAQTFSGVKSFNSFDTKIGTGSEDPNGTFINVGDLNSPNSVSQQARSSNRVNIDFVTQSKGAGQVLAANESNVAYLRSADLRMVRDQRLYLDIDLPATTDGKINALVTGDTILYTVPNKILTITKIILRPISSGANTLPPTFSFGSNSPAFDDIMPATSLVGAVNIDNAWNFTVQGASKTFNSGAVIKARVSVAATGNTALDYKIELYGILR